MGEGGDLASFWIYYGEMSDCARGADRTLSNGSDRGSLKKRECSLSGHPCLKTCESGLAPPRDLTRLPKARDLYELNRWYVRRYLKTHFQKEKKKKGISRTMFVAVDVGVALDVNSKQEQEEISQT